MLEIERIDEFEDLIKLKISLINKIMSLIEEILKITDLGLNCKK